MFVWENLLLSKAICIYLGKEIKTDFLFSLSRALLIRKFETFDNLTIIDNFSVNDI